MNDFEKQMGRKLFSKKEEELNYNGQINLSKLLLLENFFVCENQFSKSSKQMTFEDYNQIAFLFKEKNIMLETKIINRHENGYFVLHSKNKITFEIHEILNQQTNHVNDIKGTLRYYSTFPNGDILMKHKIENVTAQWNLFFNQWICAAESTLFNIGTRSLMSYEFFDIC